MTAFKKITVYFLVFFFFFVYTGKSFATDSTLNSEVESEEEERNQKLRSLLGLELPTETDNPSYQVVFTEPENSDVQIKVDDGDYSVKKSPYTLPSLSIGSHTITFQFKDEDGVTQTLAEKIIIIPRAPLFSDTGDLSFASSSDVVFSGTAVPNSSVVFLISSELIMKVVAADSEGSWTLTLDEELDEGSHQIVGFVRKDGYASDFSEAVTFNIGTSTETSLEVGEPDNSFNINIDWQKIFSEENKYYFIGAGGVVLLVILVFVSQSLKSNAQNGKEIEKLNGDKKNDDGKKMTIREKLSASISKVEKPVEVKKKVVDDESKASSVQGVEKEESIEDIEKEIKETVKKEVVKSNDEKISDIKEKPAKKKSFLSFLGFGRNSAPPEATSKLGSGGDVKKVVTKEEFLDGYNDEAQEKIIGKEIKGIKGDKTEGSVLSETSPNGELKTVTQESSSAKDKKETEKLEKNKKSNTIEVTLG